MEFARSSILSIFSLEFPSTLNEYLFPELSVNSIFSLRGFGAI